MALKRLMKSYVKHEFTNYQNENSWNTSKLTFVQIKVNSIFSKIKLLLKLYIMSVVFALYF